MKTLIKKIFVSLTIIFSIASVANLAPISASAANGEPMNFSCRYFLGMTSWDCGISNFQDDGDSSTNQKILENNIVIILANVLNDLAVLAAYLVLGFVIYGGYMYIFSSGDPGKIQNGKKTLTRAFIGLAIVILTNVILNAIRFAFLNNGQTWADCQFVDASLSMAGASECLEPTSVIENALQWFVGTSGVVALIFVVVGGVGYVTSAGDPGKLQKAKNTIIYALIGLVVVAVAELLVSFISGIIHNADPSTSYINQTTIAKEYHETQIN